MFSQCFSAFAIFVSLVVLAAKGDPIPTVPEKVCHFGTFTYYGDADVQYDRLRRSYANCTHIMGNLVIANLQNEVPDLSFLENIRYVSGYVGIYLNSHPTVVSLPSLEIIRGNDSFVDFPVRGVSDISLLIALNDHHEIRMPKLKEITSGNVLVLLDECPDLCYVDTIDWDIILRSGTVKFTPNNNICASCSDACEHQGRGRHCWGSTPDLCQQRIDAEDCSPACGNGLCSVTNSSVCCSEHCALGCYGHRDTDCFACKDYKMEDGSCSAHCPLYPLHIPIGQRCVFSDNMNMAFRP